MSNQSIKDLSSKEIIDIELENLSLLFLLGFSHQDQPCSVLWFINYCRKGVDENEDYKVCQALSEAFQWLCNEGLIAKYIPKGTMSIDYFITRKGLRKLEDIS